MEILKKLRKEKQLTTDQLAKIIHVSKRTIENYESGKTNPDYETLIKFAKIYEVSIDYLLGQEKDIIVISKEEYNFLLELKKIINKIELREKNKKVNFK